MNRRKFVIGTAATPWVFLSGLALPQEKKPTEIGRQVRERIVAYAAALNAAGIKFE